MTRRFTESILIADVLVICAAFFLAYYIRYLSGPSPATFSYFVGEWWPMILPAIVLWPILYVHMRLDGFTSGWHFPGVAAQLTLAVTLLITLMLALGYLDRQYYSRLVLLLFGIFVLLGFITVRCCTRYLLASKTRSGRTRKVAILGNGNVAQELANKIQRHPELMLQVVGFLYPEGSDSAAPSADPPATRSVSSLGVTDLFRQLDVEELIVALTDASAPETRKLIALCRSQGFHVSLIPQWYELYLSKARLVEIDGLPMVSLENRSFSSVSLLSKRVMDLALGFLLLLLALPVLVVIAGSLYVRRGQAFKFEVRCGKDGKPFNMYRFCIDRDHPDRLTGHERLLAKLSLTELPQLWNVLIGDMSLVGPRPESPERVRHYSDWQKQRLSIPPGLTGLAQVYGLRDQHSSEDKARYDLQYIYHRSVFLDLSLVLQSAWTLAVRLWHSDAPGPESRVAGRGSIPLTEAMSANSTHSGTD